VISTLEGDDPRLPGDQQARPKRDLDRVLPGNGKEYRVTALPEPPAQLGGDVGLGEVAERVDAPLGLFADCGQDVRIPMSEGGDSEASGEIDVLAAVRVDDPAALRLRPDHGFNRLSVSTAM
jgi:hypothetical protein